MKTIYNTRSKRIITPATQRRTNMRIFKQVTGFSIFLYVVIFLLYIGGVH